MIFAAAKPMEIQVLKHQPKHQNGTPKWQLNGEYHYWLVVYLPLCKILVRLDHHPNYWGKQKMFQTTNQIIIFKTMEFRQVETTPDGSRSGLRQF